jgi:hypothetical protein
MTQEWGGVVKLRALAASVITVGLFLAAGTLAAHHSFSSVFDREKMVSFKGVVTAIDWVNPHIYIYVEMKAPDGKVERWVLEGPSVNGFLRTGLDRGVFKLGDTLEICGYGAKDASAGRTDSRSGQQSRPLSAELITFPDGVKLAWAQYGTNKCLEPPRR